MTANGPSWLQDRSVLVVDRDRAVRDAICGLLEPRGCRMITASAGSDALAEGSTLPRVTGLDAVITEIRLPDMHSYELVTRLQEEIQRPLAIVLMTEFGFDPQYLGEYVPSSHFLYMPFRANQLFRVLKMALVGQSAAEGKQSDQPISG